MKRLLFTLLASIGWSQPVIAVDVVVVLQDGFGGYQGTQDAQLLKGYNLGGWGQFGLSELDEPALIKFDLSNIPQSAKVKSASLELSFLSCGFSDEEINRSWTVGAYQCDHDWIEGTGTDSARTQDGASLDSFNGIDPWPGGKVAMLLERMLGKTVIPGGQDQQWYKWPLDASLVQKWISGGQPNFGIAVSGKPPGKHLAFVSSESPMADRRPILRLELAVAGSDVSGLAAILQNDLRYLERPTVGCWYHPFYSLKKGELEHWNDVKAWNRPLPVGGFYDMEDRKTFNRQTKEMRACGINFIVFDDTNCVHVNDGQIDRRITTWFDYMDALPQKERLLLCIAPGGELNVHNNRQDWLESVNYLYDQYANRPSYARLEGKPLFLWYIDKDVWPEWTDERWTVRKAYAHHRPESKKGFSWGVRGVPSPDNECMPVTPGWHRPDSPDSFPRENGDYYRRGWLEVLRHQPRCVLLASWNEHAEACSIEDNTEYGNQYRVLTAGYVAAARHKRLDGFVYTTEGTADSYKWSKSGAVKTRLRDTRTNIVVPKDYFPP